MATCDLCIKNGTLVTGTETYQATIYVKDEKIIAVTAPDVKLLEANETIDAAGLHVLPGLMDTHVHSRDPGPTHKEDFYHSTRAAAAGGITTVFEMPNTTPPVDNAAHFDQQKDNLSSKAAVDFGLWGICLGHLNNNKILELHERGVISFKFFWGYAVHEKTFQLMYNYKPGMDNVIPPFHDGEVYEMMEHVSNTGQIFAVHAENNDLIQTLTSRVEERGGSSYGDLLEGRPSLAEVLTVQTGISMARATGVRFHVLHVSSGEAVELVRQAQHEGLPVTVETCPHYLFLSAEQYNDIGSTMKVYPPVKFKKDQDAIWEGIKDGTISAVCSDHAPHTAEEKDGELWSIPAGMCGVETLAPLMLNAVSEKRISLNRFVQLLSEEPARMYGIAPQKGTLQPGSDADFTFVDMNKEGTIEVEKLHSKSKVSAYNGFPVKGWPVRTIVRGRTVMHNGSVIEDSTGQLVTPVQKGTAIHG
ncbi:allantoinase AllB [Alteribacillus sp. HJP-4]|uniref:allantoinase AllB n=1 Tax=Alteribacillus sp. HJP-4 TaxID=2775394 RepID=UPI0035CD298C